MNFNLRAIVFIVAFVSPAFLILWGIMTILFANAFDVSETNNYGWLYVIAGFVAYFLELVVYANLKKNGYLD